MVGDSEDLIRKANEESSSIFDYSIIRKNSERTFTVIQYPGTTEVLYKRPEELTDSEMTFCNEITKRFYMDAGSRGWINCVNEEIHDSLQVAVEADSRYVIITTRDSPLSDEITLNSFALFKFSFDWEDDPDDEVDDQIQVPCLYLYQLHTINSFRGRGNGSCILNILEDLASKYRFPKIKLTVLKGNEQAIKLYEKRGFSLDSTDPSHFEFPSDHDLYNVSYWIYSKSIQ